MNNVFHKRLTPDEIARELFLCKSNILYFIDNYVKLPQPGGFLEYKLDNINKKIRQYIVSTIKFQKSIICASRQLGKTSSVSVMLLWATMFFPGSKAVLLTLKKQNALEFIRVINHIHGMLPDWMKVPIRGRGSLLTYIAFSNGSRIDTLYISSSVSPDNISRGLTVPIIAIDEFSNIAHIKRAYGSAVPAISKAREIANKNGYPTFITILSTPNGVSGIGEFFYELYTGAIPSEDIFDDDGRLIEEYRLILDNPEKNGFIRVRYHWSEDKTKDQKWYNEMVKDLNWDMRLINQEINILFVGSSNCIFDDDTIAKFKSADPLDKINLPFFQKLKVYRKLEKYDYAIIGIDTAKSLTGDYTAIEIYSYKDFEQIAEYSGKLGSLTKFLEIVKFVIDYVMEFMGERVLIAIENNSIGASIIEGLENDTSKKYAELIYTPEPKKGTGINTNLKSKPVMVSEFYDQVVNNPDILASSDLINQLSVIEKRANGVVCAQSGSNDDLFMASSFCAYVKKISSLEYDHRIGVSNKKIKESDRALVDNIYINKYDKFSKINESMEKYLKIYGDEDETPQDNDFDLPFIL
jgi:hypothetical protein